MRKAVDSECDDYGPIFVKQFLLKILYTTLCVHVRGFNCIIFISINKNMEKFQVIKMSYLVWSSHREMEQKMKQPLHLSLWVCETHTHTHTHTDSSTEEWWRMKRSQFEECLLSSIHASNSQGGWKGRPATLPHCCFQQTAPPHPRLQGVNLEMKCYNILPSPENPLEQPQVTRAQLHTN